MPMHSLFVALTLVLTISGQQAKPSPADYLDEALTLMETHSLRRDRVDWLKLRAETTAMIKDAKTTADTYNAVRFALASLRDRHSRFLTPSQAVEAERDVTPAPPSAAALPEGIGHLKITGARIASEKAITEYATAAHQHLLLLHDKAMQAAIA